MAKRLFPLLSLITISLLHGCMAPRIQTIWKAQDPLPYRYEKILVVAIVPGTNDSLRASIEKQAVLQLTQNGYHAVSYIDGFSIYEISESTTQEAAYFTLCEKGIDCILTIAKVDPQAVVSLKKGTQSWYPASFYFNHIWDYRKLESTSNGRRGEERIWECILFDLRSMGQQSVLQVDRVWGLKNKNESLWIIQNIIARLFNEKLIARPDSIPPTRYKGF